MKRDRPHNRPSLHLRLAVAIVALLEAVASGVLAVDKVFSDMSSTAPLWSLCGFAAVAFFVAMASMITDRRSG